MVAKNGHPDAIVLGEDGRGGGDGGVDGGADGGLGQENALPNEFASSSNTDEWR